jgi:hypothetical protein
MNIGRERRTIYIEPIDDPSPVAEPVPDPEPLPETAPEPEPAR